MSSFQNGLNDPFSLNGSYLKNKVIEGSHKGEKYFFEVVTFFSCLAVIQSTQFLSGNTYSQDSCFSWSIFPLNYQNSYDYQTFQGSDMLQGALTLIYA